VVSESGWTKLVERAVAEAVDVVLLAGDVIDQFNRSFEAWGPLDEGVRRLGDAGIPVVAVAGNHDFDTLPDVAAEVGDGHLRLLGAGGRWERWTLEAEDGSPRLHVDGWSFPRQRYPSDPTEAYPAEPARAPVLGLLHCDLDQAESTYGPVSSARLRSLPVDAWVLGHIHVPSLSRSSGGPPLLYPGSLQALDPGEPGPHGAWLLRLATGTAPSFERVSLSAVRYDTVEVDVEGCGERGEVTARVREALADHLGEVAPEGGGHLRAVRCRVRLTGRTGLHDRLPEILEGLEDFEAGTGGDVRLSVAPRPILDTRPALDLRDLARGNDPAAHLARLLLALEEEAGAPGPSPAPGDRGEVEDRLEEPGVDPDLLEEASRSATEVARRTHYAAQGLEVLDTGPGSEAVLDALRRQAGRLLDAMVADREGP
jgi:predicted phosphodiesterase